MHTCMYGVHVSGCIQMRAGGNSSVSKNCFVYALHSYGGLGLYIQEEVESIYIYKCV